jgi:hypothetical protein
VTSHQEKNAVFTSGTFFTMLSSSESLDRNKLAHSMNLHEFSKHDLDEVVATLKRTMSDPLLRQMNNRMVQGTVWHQTSDTVSKVLTNLRNDELTIRQRMFHVCSELIFAWMGPGLGASFSRAGIHPDPRIHAGSALDDLVDFDLFCLDAKERLYLLLKNYKWTEEFFRANPIHFYENSFQFIDRIPPKKLPVSVKVVGLGIGGSMAVSGLAKHGIEAVYGFEKRTECGPKSVTSRVRCMDVKLNSPRSFVFET